ncbi:MAG TPA: hypothetical protein DG761_08335 [Gammaproteobacteria bacterium]|nr:hypothetical protein [Acidiferrobacteraceae bacterium]HCX88021.1 hypothetical protein [Gammaproteobacteria bacterium]
MKQKGFTLIELMIVIVIIGVLAAVAIPQYNQYQARTQVAEAFTMLGSVKQALTLYYQENGEFPQEGNPASRADVLGILRKNQWSANTDYIRRLWIINVNGKVRVVFKAPGTPGVNELIAGKHFELKPVLTGSVITSWECVPAGTPSKKIDEAYIKSCM